jgi:hypothetical protein
VALKAKQNTNKTTQSDGSSALQIFTTIQTFLFLTFLCTDGASQDKKDNKTNKNENPTHFCNVFTARFLLVFYPLSDWMFLSKVCL